MTTGGRPEGNDDVAQDQIRAFVERILRMKEEAKAIYDDIREIYSEAKGNGFDKTVLGKVVNYVEKRAKDSNAVAEADTLFDLYLEAFDGTPSRTHAHEAEMKAINIPAGVYYVANNEPADPDPSGVAADSEERTRSPALLAPHSPVDAEGSSPTGGTDVGGDGGAKFAPFHAVKAEGVHIPHHGRINA